MGLSKLSEKCEKCDRKDACDEKRMEACAYIIPTIPKFAACGIVNSDSMYISRNTDIKIVVSFGGKPIQHSHEVIDSIQKAICDFQIGG